LATVTDVDYAAEVLRLRGEPKSATFVRLTGLQGAAQLNGREGVLRGQDPNNPERVTVSVVNGGVTISVRSHNYEVIQRPKVFIDDFV
jgi:hypothetical protein